MAKASKAQKKAMKRWQRKNKQKLKEYRRKYYLEHRAETEQPYIPKKSDRLDLIRLEKFVREDIGKLKIRALADKYNAPEFVMKRFIIEREIPNDYRLAIPEKDN